MGSIHDEGRELRDQVGIIAWRVVLLLWIFADRDPGFKSFDIFKRLFVDDFSSSNTQRGVGGILKFTRIAK